MLRDQTRAEMEQRYLPQGHNLASTMAPPPAGPQSSLDSALPATGPTRAAPYRDLLRRRARYWRPTTIEWRPREYHGMPQPHLTLITDYVIAAKAVD